MPMTMFVQAVSNQSTLSYIFSLAGDILAFQKSIDDWNCDLSNFFSPSKLVQQPSNCLMRAMNENQKTKNICTSTDILQLISKVIHIFCVWSRQLRYFQCFECFECYILAKNLKVQWFRCLRHFHGKWNYVWQDTRFFYDVAVYTCLWIVFCRHKCKKQTFCFFQPSLLIYRGAKYSTKTVMHMRIRGKIRTNLLYFLILDDV